MTDAGDRGGRGFIAYAISTLALVGAATVIVGGTREVGLGMFTAWVIQLVAFRPLARALSEQRDARSAWLGGLAIRGAGLIGTGGLAVAGRFESDLPVSYGTTMMVLLLAEAGWLFRRLPRAGGFATGAAGTDDGIERTTTR
ncbi:MAG: hypothetical protein ACC682_03180 [Gemmatimonadota bacterium]